MGRHDQLHEDHEPEDAGAYKTEQGNPTKNRSAYGPASHFLERILCVHLILHRINHSLTMGWSLFDAQQYTTKSVLSVPIIGIKSGCFCNSQCATMQIGLYRGLVSWRLCASISANDCDRYADIRT